MLALKDGGDSKDEHDDSESDGGAGGGHERDDDCVLLLPMTALSLSQVTDAQQIPWLYQDDSRGPGKQQQDG